MSGGGGTGHRPVVGRSEEDVAKITMCSFIARPVAEFERLCDSFRTNLVVEALEVLMMAHLRWICLLLLIALPRVAEGTLSYEQAMARAAELERAGKPAEGAALLAPLSERYPQDLALHLRLAWLSYLAGHYVAAEAHYRGALALSPQSRDAQHGLAWALLKGGRRAEAHAQFKQVVERWPELELARQGLAASAPVPPVSISPRLHAIGQIYQDNPLKAGAVGFSFTLPLLIVQRVLLSTTYRFAHFIAAEDALGVGGTTLEQSFQQHEAHVSLGLVWPKWGVAAHYAYLHDGSFYLDYGYIVGLSGRVSPWGDIWMQASASLYPDMTVFRLAPSYRLPLLDWLSVTPGLHLQVAHEREDTLQLDQTDEVTVGGSLTVTLHHRLGDLWLGGKYGDEVRPAYLALPAAYNTPDRIRFGFWGGISVRPSPSLRLNLSYELVHMETMVNQNTLARSNLHLLVLGGTWSSL